MERNLSPSPDGILLTNLMTDKSYVFFIVAERKERAIHLFGSRGVLILATSTTGTAIESACLKTENDSIPACLFSA